MCLEVLGDGRKALAQFLPVAPVPSVAKRAEPLVAVSQADDRAGAHRLPALASGVASSADIIQSAEGWRQGFGLRQGALTGGLTRAIQIKDEPRVAHPIDQALGLPLVGVRTAEQIFREEG